MTEFHIRHLAVVDQIAPVGMVSERDLLAAIGWWASARNTQTPQSQVGHSALRSTR